MHTLIRSAVGKHTEEHGKISAVAVQIGSRPFRNTPGLQDILLLMRHGDFAMVLCNFIAGDQPLHHLFSEKGCRVLQSKRLYQPFLHIPTDRLPSDGLYQRADDFTAKSIEPVTSRLEHQRSLRSRPDLLPQCWYSAIL